MTDPNAPPPPVEPEPPADPLAHFEPSDEQVEAVSNSWNQDISGRVYGKTPEQYAAELEEKMTRELDASQVDIVVRTPGDVAEVVANDGRFKSQFESRASMGMYDPKVRAEAESDLFGYPENLDPKERPIYGYVRGVTREPGSVESYGNTVWYLKNDVRSRTTWTANDSLGMMMVPSPIDRPSHLSVDPRQATRVGPRGSPTSTSCAPAWATGRATTSRRRFTGASASPTSIACRWSTTARTTCRGPSDEASVLLEAFERAGFGIKVDLRDQRVPLRRRAAELVVLAAASTASASASTAALSTAARRRPSSRERAR